MNNITLWNINDYSLQEIFDAVATHLLTQKEKSHDYLEPDGKLNCTYKSVSDNGTVLHCAVGCLIPEDKYDASFEGRYITALLSYLDLAISRNKIDLLIHLQVIHDTTLVSEWYSSLIDIATLYDLNTLTLDKFK